MGRGVSGAGVVALRLGRAVAAHLCEGATRARRGWVGTRGWWEGSGTTAEATTGRRRERETRDGEECC